MVDIFEKSQVVYDTLTEGAQFLTGASPRILDVAKDMGQIADGGSIFIPQATGNNMFVEIETNEGQWETQFTVYKGESFPLENFNLIKRIRLTWIANTDFRIIASKRR